MIIFQDNSQYRYCHDKEHPQNDKTDHDTSIRMYEVCLITHFLKNIFDYEKHSAIGFNVIAKIFE